MRTRVTAFTSPESVSSTHDSAAGSCADPEHFQYYTTYVQTFNGTKVNKTTNDVVTPKFRSKIKRGEIINNPYDRTLVQETIIPTTIDARNSYYSSVYCSGVYKDVVTWGYRLRGKRDPATYIDGGWSALLPTPALDAEWLKDLAVTQAWAKADESETLALVTMAEGEKTIKSFVDLSKRFIRIIKHLRRGKWWKLRNELSLKELSSRWMEARYAIRPFLYDVQTTMAAYKTTGGNHSVRQTLRSHATDTGIATQSGVVSNYIAGAWRVYVTKMTQRTVTARAGVLADLQPLTSADIWGLNLPFESLWELVPFSFVVDWFWNVGKTIASWTPDLRQGIKPLASWLVVDDTTVATVAIERSESLYTHPKVFESVFTLTGGSLTRTTSSRYRIVNPSRPIIPSTKIRFDVAKLLDLVIMGKQLTH